MGIFSRFRDIVNSNINAMLDKAEDPEKLIKLMIQEMEDTLVELKASCAGAMASRARVLRTEQTASEKADNWAAKARLAMEKGREDLAREALTERRAFADEAEARRSEAENLTEIITKYQDDIQQLEEKLVAARNKHRVLVQRHIQARHRRTAQEKIRTAETSDAMARFDSFESRIDRMEADADLVNFGRKNSLDEEFASLERNDKVEDELNALKEEVEKRRQRANTSD
jgi:phage shock protein A